MLTSNSMSRTFALLTRNHTAWASCLSPVDNNAEVMSLHVMGPNLLHATGGSSISHSPSPLSDSDNEKASEHPVSDNNDDLFASTPFVANQFVSPDPSSQNYHVLRTPFNFDTPANQHIPYPTGDVDVHCQWTSNEHLEASQAYTAHTLEDTGQSVSIHSFLFSLHLT